MFIKSVFCAITIAVTGTGNGLIGKTVRVRRGPAAVTGNEGRSTDATVRQNGKARLEDDPEARRPARNILGAYPVVGLRRLLWDG